MSNVIKRSTLFMETIALTNCIPFIEGECAGFFKWQGKWVVKDSNNALWTIAAKHLRNEKLFQIVKQWTMDDIVLYLMDRNEDYQTVDSHILEDAINTALMEGKICCIEDLYEYIVENLI